MKYTVNITKTKHGSTFTNYKIIEEIYEFCLENRELPIILLPTSVLFTFIIAIYLLWAIGYEKNQKEIQLSYVDRLPYELVILAWAVLITIFLSIAIECLNIGNYITIIIALVLYFICYIICAITGITTIKRIKKREFIKSFFIYKMGNWCYKKIRKWLNIINEKATEQKRLFWYYLLFIIISVALASLFYTVISILLLIGFWICTYYKLKVYIINQDKIKEALRNIYEGKNDINLNENELQGVLKEMSVYVNDIASGFSNAISESLKSERLKTELITNVSHDIKTPLTSIINYVDLLKKENIQNEKVKEYIDILDKKSQRLKKLTEDLVEASKVSSGNVKLNLEDINSYTYIVEKESEFENHSSENSFSYTIYESYQDYLRDEDNFIEKIEYEFENNEMEFSYEAKNNDISCEFNNIRPIDNNIYQFEAEYESNSFEGNYIIKVIYNDNNTRTYICNDITLTL